VRKNVQRLRGKLKDDLKAPFWIVSVHGVGYRFGGPDQTVEA
jgi:DNA-binding response OmpR family regulator